MTKVFKSRRIWLTAALFQLLLMIAGSAHLPLEALPLAGFPLSYYAEMSGASYGYGFFTPGVYGQIRTILDVYDREGNKSTQFLNVGPNREVDLRLNDVIESFLEGFQDKMKFQRSLAASFAGYVFARRPEAARVEVRVERFTAVPRRKFVTGVTASWVPVYSAQFIHNPLAKRE